MEFLEACRKIISIDSTPGNGTEDVAEFLQHLCNEFGMTTEIDSGVLRGTKQSNLVARFGPATENEFLLQTHLDTGDPGNYALWGETGKNPFDAVISDGRIFGLGAAKSKLDILCKLYAIKEFHDKSFKITPVLVGTFGQQRGMAGAVQLIRHNKVKAKWAMVGEPTNLTMVSAGKGVVVVEIRVPFSDEEVRYRTEHDELESSSSVSKMYVGRPASTSNPERGENAIEKLIEELSGLTDQVCVLDVDGGVNVHSVPVQAYLEMDIVKNLTDPISKKLIEISRALNQLKQDFTEIKNSEYDPPVSTVNLGIARTYDDHIFLSGNCRLVPVPDSSVYDRWMDRLSAACKKVGASFRITEFKKPFRTEEDHPMFAAIQDVLAEMNLPSKPGRQAKSNEANVFSRFGIDCVIFGPGEITDNAHTPSESVSLKDLDLAREVYSKCIERICL